MTTLRCFASNTSAVSYQGSMLSAVAAETRSAPVARRPNESWHSRAMSANRTIEAETYAAKSATLDLSVRRNPFPS